MGEIVVSVTAEQVTAWETEIEEIKARQERDAKRLQILNQRMDALHLFSDDEVQQSVTVKGVDASGQENLLSLSPPALVLRLVEKHGLDWMTISDLKAKIREIGYPEKKFGPGYRYLYSLFPRLVKSGKIRKDGSKVGPVPKRSPVLPGVTS